MTGANGSITILMLESDADDRFITTSMISEFPYQLNLAFVNFGEELFKYLGHCREIGDALPSVILLSLTANLREGMDVLKKLKADPLYNHIPVIVLTGVKQTAVVKECYALGASSFIEKPISARDTNTKIANFLKYWLETV
jgi:response regulator RpfG family c-di-GMP phosphodiesterase